MKCKNCGIETVESSLCESCWKIGIEIQREETYKKMRNNMTSSDLDKLKAVLDEIGGKYSECKSYPPLIYLSVYAEEKGHIHKAEFTFNKEGKLIK